MKTNKNILKAIVLQALLATSCLSSNLAATADSNDWQQCVDNGKRCFKSRDFENACKNFEKAVNIADSVNNVHYKIVALSLLAETQRSVHDFEKFNTTTNQLATVSTDKQTLSLSEQVFIQCAQAAIDSSQEKNSLGFQKLKTLAESISDLNNSDMKAYFRLGEALLYHAAALTSADKRFAKEWAEKVRVKFSGYVLISEDAQLYSRLLSALAKNALTNDHDSARAEKYLQEAIKLDATLEVQNPLLLIELGDVLISQATIQEADAILLRAKTLEENLGFSIKDQYQAILLLSDAKQSLGEYEAAIALLKILIPELNDSHEKAICLLRLAAAFTNSPNKNYEAALDCEQKAISELQISKASEQESLPALWSMGKTLRLLGRYAQAESCAFKAIDLSQSLSPDNELRVVALLDLAYVYLDWGHLENAKIHFDQLYDFANSNNLVLQKHTLLGLAEAYVTLHDYSKAEKLLFQFLDKGDEHQDADVISSYANLLRLQGEYAKSIIQYQKAAQLIKSSRGENASSLINVFYELGHTEMLLQVYAEAEKYFRRSLEINEASSVKANWSVADCLDELAWCYRLEKKFDLALSTEQKAIDIARKLSGESSVKLANYLQSFARILEDQNEHAKSSMVLKQVYGMRSNLLGKASFDTAFTLIALGDLQADQLDFNGADDYYHQALEIYAKLGKPDCPDAITARLQLAKNLRLNNSLEKSDQEYASLLELMNQKFGKDSRKLLPVLTGQALVLSSQKKYLEAHKALEQAQEICEKASIEKNRQSLEIKHQLAELLDEENRFDEAEKIWQDYFNAVRKTSPSPLELAALHHHWGLHYVKWSKKNKALEHFLSAQPLYTKTNRLELTELAALDSEIFNISQDLNSEAAAKYAREELEIQKLLGAPSGLRNAHWHNGVISHRLSRSAEAQENYQEALRLNQQLLGKNDPSNFVYLTTLAKLLQSRGDSSAASVLLHEAEALDGKSDAQKQELRHLLESLSSSSSTSLSSSTSSDGLSKAIALGKLHKIDPELSAKNSVPIVNNDEKIALPPAIKLLQKALVDLRGKKQSNSALYIEYMNYLAADYKAFDDNANAEKTIANLALSLEPIKKRFTDQYLQTQLIRAYLLLCLRTKEQKTNDSLPPLVKQLMLQSLTFADSSFGQTSDKALSIADRVSEFLIRNCPKDPYAKEVLVTTIGRLNRKYGKAAPQSIAALKRLSDLKVAQGNPQAGLSVLSEKSKGGLQLLEQTGSANKSTSSALLEQAYAVLLTGDRGTASSIAKRAFACAMAARGSSTDYYLSAIRCSEFLRGESELTLARKLMAELISTLPRHSESASLSLCLNEVAQILIAQKDYEQAESIANQSLAALPRNFSKYEPLVYETLSSAASLQGKYSLAIENTQKALERLAQTEREDRSRLLVDLSALLILNNQLDKAADTVTSAMSISDDAELQTRGEICLAKIAGLRQRNDEAISHFGKASELLQSLAPAEILLHKMEIANAKCLMNLQSKKYAEAKLLALESADLTNSYINSFLSQLSFAKQCSFVENTIQPQSDLLLTVLKANPDSDFSGQVYSRIMPWKGILVHSLYRETRLLQLAQASKNSSGSQNNETFAELTRTRNELTLTGKSRSSNTDLTGQQEALERKLWKAFKALGIDDPMSTTSVNQLQAKLRPGEVLVDIFEFTDLLEKDSRNICSRAFILTADGGNNVGLVSLEFHWGPEDKITSWLTSIEKTSLAARETGEASPSAQKHNEPKLRTELKAELWNPIETALPKDTRTTFVSPSARLATLPWNLLANDESDFLFVNVDSARQFVQGRNKQLDAKADSAKTMLLVGDIDFKDPAVSPLPGTSQEIASIKDLASGQNYVCELLERSLADKEKVRSQFPQHKIVHLATHEFFLQTKAPENKAAIDMIALSRVTEPDMSADRRNILLKSGIYLAPDTSAGTKSGATILTAEDLIALPLNGCKLVTLSAGETGMGDAIRAQGVLGLRASLIAAGADSVLMSIWRAPDEAKERLLTEFYSNLLVKNMPAAEALREAQCAMKKVPDFSAPWNWAGWIIVGIGH